jgi:hypothetical protein
MARRFDAAVARVEQPKGPGAPAGQFTGLAHEGADGLRCYVLAGLCTVTNTDRHSGHCRPPAGMDQGSFTAHILTHARRISASLHNLAGHRRISRAITEITPRISEAVREFVPAADDLDPDIQYIPGRHTAPCWSWARHKELFS